MGKLGDELNELNRQLDALDRNAAQKRLETTPPDNTKRIVRGLSTGEDLERFASPEEIERIGGVLADIAPALEALERRGAVAGPPGSPLPAPERPRWNAKTPPTTDAATTPEEVLERLRNGEGIPAHHENRLRRFFFRQWAVIHELYLSPEADPPKLSRWREAPPHSPASRKAADFDRAIATLGMWSKLEERP